MQRHIKTYKYRLFIPGQQTRSQVQNSKMKDECLYSWRTLVCTVNTGLLQLRAEKDSTANIRPNATRPTMRVIRALISTIFLLFDASGCVYSLISRLESEGSISGNHFGITWAELCMTGRIKKKKHFVDGWNIDWITKQAVTVVTADIWRVPGEQQAYEWV